MKIGVASDHRGYKMKEKVINYLKDKNYEVIDYSTSSEKSVDYPLYGFKLGESLASDKIDKAIAICGTGIGIGIAMNKVKGVICAKVSTKKEATLATEHNHANAISISGEIPFFKVKGLINSYLNSEELPDEKYKRREKELKEYK